MEALDLRKHSNPSLGAELRYNCHPAAPGERWRRDSHPAQVCVCQERPVNQDAGIDAK